MNSLKFIDDEIFATNCEITITNIELERTDIIIRKSLDKLNRLNKKLQTLQQIKTELEAWEVVKPYVDIIDKYTPYPTWQLKPNYDECKLKETNILIKALEVTNETRK